MRPTLWQRLKRAISTFGAYPSTGVAMYAGSQYNRLVSDWVMSPTSAKREIKSDLLRLRARSRQVCRDTPWGKQFLRLLADNVVGPHGMTYQARVPMRKKSAMDEGINVELERAFKEWSLPRHYSVDGRLSRIGFERLAIMSLAMDGELLVRKVRGRGRHGLQLQLIDPDLLDVTFERAAREDRQKVEMGVEMDAFGAPVAYHILTGHPSDELGVARIRRERVAAEDILHLFVSERVGQTRGIPWLAPVLLSMRHLEGYEEAELVAARTAAAKMGFFQQDADAFVAEGVPPDDEALTTEASPGNIDKLPPGVTFQGWDPQHPTTQYPFFIKAVLRSIASGMGVSYTSLANDLEGVNYSSIRAGLLQERDFYRSIQRWFCEHYCHPLHDEWVSMALLTGAMQLDPTQADRYAAVEFLPRGWAWVDPKNDLEAAELAIKTGLDTRARLLAEEGRDLEETFAQLKAEQDLAMSLGLGLELGDPKPEPAAAPAAPERSTVDESRVVEMMLAVRGEINQMAQRVAEVAAPKQPPIVAMRTVSADDLWRKRKLALVKDDAGNVTHLIEERELRENVA